MAIAIAVLAMKKNRTNNTTANVIAIATIPIIYR